MPFKTTVKQRNKELRKTEIKGMPWEYQNLKIFSLKNRIEEIGSN